MSHRRFLGAAALLVVISAGAAQAQSAGVPAEIPPASYTANQYVDSRGCAFIRAGIGGVITWVPRVNSRRSQLCNFVPSLGQVASAQTTVRAAPAPAPVAVAPVVAPARPVAAAPVAAAPAPAAPVRAAQAPAPRAASGPAPIQTVASVTTAPRMQPNLTTPVVRQPVAAPIVAPVPPAVPEPPRMTLAQACEGRFGVQRRFIDSRTLAPIDCGPAPVVAAATIAAPAPRPAALRSLTLAQACAEMAENGQTYINAATRSPIICPQAAPKVTVAATTVPPVRGSDYAALGCDIPYLLAPMGMEVRCAALNGYTVRGQHAGRGAHNASGVQATRNAGSAASAPLFAPRVPASNPIGSSHSAPARIPSGYERVWGDGRLNAQRGLPAGAPTGAVITAAPVAQTQARVSTRTAAPQAVRAPVAATHRYVQVGSFSDPSNAQRTGERFLSMGLPVAMARSGGHKIVVLGPFTSTDDLQRGLQAARGAGFGDAYTRN